MDKIEKLLSKPPSTKSASQILLLFIELSTNKKLWLNQSPDHLIQISNDILTYLLR